MIKVIVENLTVEGIDFNGEEPSDFLVLSDQDPYTISAPIKYSFTASIAAGDVLIRGTAATEISGECGI